MSPQQIGICVFETKMLIQHSLRSGLEPTTLDEVNKMAVDEWLGFVLNVFLSLDVIVSSVHGHVTKTWSDTVPAGNQ